MVRSRRSISKEDASSVLADSGISLSSPPATKKTFSLSNADEEEVILGTLCVTDDESVAEIVELESVENVIISDTDENYDEHSNESEQFKVYVEKQTTAKRSRKSYICDICQKEFRGKSDLTRHKFIHTAEKPYKCEICDKRYRQEINLKNHIISAHKKQKEFACQQCPKKFALKARLRLHMRLHTGEKPYACQQCDKSFARGGQLLQHIKTNHHDAPKQFKCEICTERFSTSSNLRAHMQAHKESSDFVCQICKENFSNTVSLRTHLHKMHKKLKQLDCDICKEPFKEKDLESHMKTHRHVKTHVCKICNSMFTQKSQYNVHMRMHTGERPFQCRLCSQTFAHSSVLKLHIRKHTGEKPFNCLLCKDTAFSQLAHLKTHMKKIHNQLKPYMCEGCQDFFKIKIDLETHQQKCEKFTTSSGSDQDAQYNEMQTLSQIRFLMAILLKKISPEERLHQLGFEKRLIDNVVIAALKVANRKSYDDSKLSCLERMLLNVEEFLNWIVPSTAMEKFKAENQSIENILENIVSKYTKKK